MLDQFLLELLKLKLYTHDTKTLNQNYSELYKFII